MKKTIATITLLCIFCLANQYVLCQINEGGNPVSFSLNIDKRAIPVIEMPPVNVEELLQEDEEVKKDNTPRPFRFECNHAHIN